MKFLVFKCLIENYFTKYFKYYRVPQDRGTNYNNRLPGKHFSDYMTLLFDLMGQNDNNKNIWNNLTKKI